MGNKGDKLTQQSEIAAAQLLDKLNPIGGVTSKRMFGGHGIFYKGKMFGMVDSKGEAFLKTDDTIKHHFEEINALKHSRMPYFAIPKAVLNTPEELVKWAGRSIAILK